MPRTNLAVKLPPNLPTASCPKCKASWAIRVRRPVKCPRCGARL